MLSHHFLYHASKLGSYYGFSSSSSAINPKQPSLQVRLENLQSKINDKSWHETKRYAALEQWINLQRDEGIYPIPLAHLDLSDMRLDGISFELAVLSRANWDAILAGGGSVLGATLDFNDPIIDAQSISLDGVVFNKNMADCLIDAGVDFKTVLTCFLQFPPDVASHRQKGELLQQYLTIERAAYRIPIELRDVDLNGALVTNVDFHDTLIGSDNLIHLFAGSADLRGARLADGTQSPPLHRLDFVKLDKIIALQLIDAGADAKSVFLNYYSTQLESGIAIDYKNELREFGLKETTDTSLGLSYLTRENPAAMDTPNADSKSQFQKEFLALLKAYAIVISDLVKQSGTRDLSAIETKPMDKWPDHVFQKTDHQDVIRHVQRSHQDWTIASFQERLTDALRYASGDCGEMGLMGKSILDLFLQTSLARLGWKVKWDAIYMQALRPSSHYVVKVVCTLNDTEFDFLFDPWSKEAWPFNEGLTFFRTHPDGRFTHADTTFVQSNTNTLLNRPEFNAHMSKVYDKFGVEHHIAQVLKERKDQF